MVFIMIGNLQLTYWIYWTPTFATVMFYDLKIQDFYKHMMMIFWILSQSSFTAALLSY